MEVWLAPVPFRSCAPAAFASFWSMSLSTACSFLRWGLMTKFGASELRRRESVGVGVRRGGGRTRMRLFLALIVPYDLPISLQPSLYKL